MVKSIDPDFKDNLDKNSTTLKPLQLIDFDDDGNYEADISSYLTASSIDIKMESVSSRAIIDNVTSTVDNSNGDFSPKNSDSQYAGNVVPGRNTKLSITDGTYQMELFTGTIEDYEPNYDESEVSITTKDKLKLLKKHNAPDKFYIDEPKENVIKEFLDNLSYLGFEYTDNTIDSMQDQITYSFSGMSYFEAFSMIAESEWGSFYFSDGLFYFKSGINGETGDIVKDFNVDEGENNTFSIIENYDKNDIYNKIEINSNPRELSEEFKVWEGLKKNQSKKIAMNFSDISSNQLDLKQSDEVEEFFLPITAGTVEIHNVSTNTTYTETSEIITSINYDEGIIYFDDTYTNENNDTINDMSGVLEVAWYYNPWILKPDDGTGDYSKTYTIEFENPIYDPNTSSPINKREEGLRIPNVKARKNPYKYEQNDKDVRKDEYNYTPSDPIIENFDIRDSNGDLKNAYKIEETDITRLQKVKIDATVDTEKDKVGFFGSIPLPVQGYDYTYHCYAKIEIYDNDHNEILPVNYSFLSEYDTWVKLQEQNIEADSESLTNFDRGTDYEMDYSNGKIKVLSSGNMANATKYNINYEYKHNGIEVDEKIGFSKTFDHSRNGTYMDTYTLSDEWEIPNASINKTYKILIYHPHTNYSGEVHDCKITTISRLYDHNENSNYPTNNLDFQYELSSDRKRLDLTITNNDDVQLQPYNDDNGSIYLQGKIFRQNENKYIEEDADSINNFGRKDLKIDNSLVTQGKDLANYILTKYKTPTSKLKLEAKSYPYLELNDRVNLNFSQHDIDDTFFIKGINHNIQDGDISTTYELEQDEISSWNYDGGTASLPISKPDGSEDENKAPESIQTLNVTVVQASLKNGNVVLLEWDAVKEKDLQGYIIERKRSSDNNWITQDIVERKTLQYKDTATDYNEDYDYRVITIDLQDNQSTNNPVESVNVKVNNKPVEPKFEKDKCFYHKEVYLKWVARDDSTFNFELRKDLNWGTNDGNLIYRGMNNEYYYKDETSRRHTFYLKSINNNGVYSNDYARILITNAPPSQPAQPTTRSHFEKIFITPQETTDDNDDIQGYKIYVIEKDENIEYTVDDITNKINEGTPETTEIIDMAKPQKITYPGEEGKTYLVQTTAYDNLGESIFSNYDRVSTADPDGIAAFARQLDKPKVVNSLPSLPDEEYPPGRYVFLTSDRKIYKNIDNTWQSDLDATDQLIVGAVQAGAIGADEVAANELYAKHINTDELLVEKSAQIADATITDAKIDSLSGNKIEVGSTPKSAFDDSTQSEINDGVTANDETIQYRKQGSPTNQITPIDVTTEKNTNGTLDIKVEWDKYNQGDKKADFIMLFYDKTTISAGWETTQGLDSTTQIYDEASPVEYEGTESVKYLFNDFFDTNVIEDNEYPTSVADKEYEISNFLGTPNENDSVTTFNVNTFDPSYYTLEGVSADKFYSFGLGASRKTENGLETTKIQQVDGIVYDKSHTNADYSPISAGGGAVEIDKNGIKGTDGTKTTFEINTDGSANLDGKVSTTDNGILLSELHKNSYGGYLSLFDGADTHVATIGASEEDTTPKQGGLLNLSGGEGNNKISLGAFGISDLNTSGYGELKLKSDNNITTVDISAGFGVGSIKVGNDSEPDNIELNGATGRVTSKQIYTGDITFTTDSGTATVQINPGSTNGEIKVGDTYTTDKIELLGDNGQINCNELMVGESGIDFEKQANGYTKLVNGLILQWGRTQSYSGDANDTIYFPTSFPTNCLQVTASAYGSRTNIAGSSYVIIDSISADSFNSHLNDASGCRVMWMAIGY